MTDPVPRTVTHPAPRIRFSLRQLEAFCAVARLGNASQAAAEIGRTPSAVSMALRDLEQALGITLFERRGRALALTADGARIRAGARELLDRAAELPVAQGRDDAHAPPLTIGASRTIGVTLMPELLGDFRALAPDARFSLTVANTEEILAGLARYDIDVAFVEGTVTDPSLHNEIWLRDELCVFARPGHPLLEKRPRPARGFTMAQLAKCQWALREPGSGTREAFLRAMEGYSALDVRAEISDNDALRRLVQRSDWLGCLSRRSVEESLRSGALIEVTLASGAARRALSRSFRLLLNPQRFQNAGTRQFLAHARRWARQARGGPAEHATNTGPDTGPAPG
ncbi:MAG: LysR substrate-binding domain-containing protein [Burkholderiales bacterium]|nr:LysR substrate-binding domain-containing protein [Burkholderiales bacterium]